MWRLVLINHPNEEGGGGRGAESYDRKKAWSSVNRSILSGRHCQMVMPAETSPSETVIFKDPRIDSKKSIPPAFVA
jgi:hypothetical protein